MAAAFIVRLSCNGSDITSLSAIGRCNISINRLRGCATNNRCMASDAIGSSWRCCDRHSSSSIAGRFAYFIPVLIRWQFRCMY